MKIIVGLGNPGLLYKSTRHNVGFMFVDEIVKFYQGKWVVDKKKRLEEAIIKINNEKLILVKPLTYMNLSGEAVKNILNYYKLTSDDLLIIYDDLDFALGSFRIKPTGSSGGHKGIKSIIDSLGTQDIKRIRIGILSASKQEDTTVDYVLGRFSKDEKKIIDELKKLAPLWANDFLFYDFEDLMSKYNKKNGS